MLIVWWQRASGGPPPVTPPTETVTGGWESGRTPKIRRGEYDFLGRIPSADKIKEERIRLGIVEPDTSPDESIDSVPDAILEDTGAFDPRVFDELQARLAQLTTPDKTYDLAKLMALDPLLRERLEAADAMLIALILAQLD